MRWRGSKPACINGYDDASMVTTKRKERQLKRIITGVAVAAAITGLAGCHSSNHHPSAIASNPVVHKDVTALERQAEGCAQHANFLTKHGRKLFYACASAGTAKTPAQFETCAQKQLTSTALLSKKGRAAFAARVAQNCVVAAK